MARQKIKEFYAPEELTPELLNGLVDETELRPMEILQFVDLVQHETETIELDVLIQQTDRFANIVGFADSSIATKGLETEKKFVNPFHVKNYHEFKLTDSKFMQRSGESVVISAAGIAQSSAMQEQKRRNLLHWATLAMIDQRTFTYQDGDKLLTVDYTSEIGVLPAPTGGVIDVSGFALRETNRMKNTYYRLNRQVPNLAFMSAATALLFTDIAEVKAAYVALQSADPESSASLFQRFSWNGMVWVILHEQYPDIAGMLLDPITKGRIVVTVDSVLDPNPDAAGSPFKMHRASNALNNNNAARPFYDMFEVSNDPIAWGHRLYDNMVPGVSKRNAVMQWEVITP